jgi:hypothetical protein
LGCLPLDDEGTTIFWNDWNNVPNDTVSHPRMSVSSMNASVWTSNLILNRDKLCTHFSSFYQPYPVHCEIKTIVIDSRFLLKFHAPLKSSLRLVCLYGWATPIYIRCT